MNQLRNAILALFHENNGGPLRGRDFHGLGPLPTVMKEMRELVNEGLVIQEGSKAASTYRLNQPTILPMP